MIQEFEAVDFDIDDLEFHHLSRLKALLSFLAHHDPLSDVKNN